jgi:hypothetical protein
LGFTGIINFLETKSRERKSKWYRSSIGNVYVRKYNIQEEERIVGKKLSLSIAHREVELDG